MTDLVALTQALEVFDDDLYRPHEQTKGLLAFKLAARRLLDWFQPCPTCNGHGMVTNADGRTTLERAMMHDCPVCRGVGVEPTKEAVEAVAHGMFTQAKCKDIGGYVTGNHVSAARAALMALWQMKGKE